MQAPEIVTIQLPLDMARRVRRITEISRRPLDRAIAGAIPVSLTPQDKILLTGEDLYTMGEIEWVELVEEEIVHMWRSHRPTTAGTI